MKPFAVAKTYDAEAVGFEKEAAIRKDLAQGLGGDLRGAGPQGTAGGASKDQAGSSSVR